MPSLSDRLWNWVVDPMTPGATTYGGGTNTTGVGVPNQSDQVIPPGSPDTWELPNGQPTGSEPGWWDLYPTNYGDALEEQTTAVGGALGKGVGIFSGAFWAGVGSGFKAAPLTWILIAIALLLIFVPGLWPASVAVTEAGLSKITESAKRQSNGRFKGKK